VASFEAASQVSPAGASVSIHVFSHGSRSGLRSSAVLRLSGRGVDSAERDRKGGRDCLVQLSKIKNYLVGNTIYLRLSRLKHAVNRKTG